MDLETLRPDWPTPPGVRAAFTLRRGGVSEPPFETLNLALHTGDAPDAVLENRRRLSRALELPAEPAWLNQVHGTGVVRLAAVDTVVDLRADAAVTGEPGRICAIQVADCIPVLFAARDGSAVGAAHAGWRGLASGVLEATVGALQTLGATPADLIAWLGPGIGATHFEVGDEVRAAFPGSGHAFAPNARGRWQCDLAGLARERLEALGMRELYGGRWCTFTDAERFFSYRRDGRCGRMAALVWIEA